MYLKKYTYPVLISTIALTLTVSCQTSPVKVTEVPTPSAAPTTQTPVVQPSVAPVEPTAPQAMAKRYISGSADAFGSPFADAEVRIFTLAGEQAIAQGKTGSDGRFTINLSDDLVPGSPLKIVASKGDQTMVTIAKVLAAPEGGLTTKLTFNEAVLNFATTLAYLMSGERLEGLGETTSREDLLSRAYQAYSDLVDVLLRGSTDATSSDNLAVFDALDPNGNGSLPDDVAARLGASSEVTNVFREVLEDLKDALTDALESGGTSPDIDENIEEAFFGNLPTPTATQSSSSGGGGGGGGGSGAGNNSANVEFEGNLTRPEYSPTPWATSSPYEDE